MKVFIFLILISLPFFVVLANKHFLVTDLECHSQFGKCDNEFTSRILRGLPVKYSNLDSYLTNVLQDESEVYKYTYQLKLPSRIRLDVVIRKPVFALKSDSVTSASLVDQDGKVVGISEDTTLASMYIEEQLPNVGQSVSEETMSRILIAQGIYKIVNVEKLMVKGSDIYIDSTNVPEIVLPTDKDHELLLGSVGLVLSRLKHIQEETKIDISEISRIDFRYKDPIIVK